MDEAWLLISLNKKINELEHSLQTLRIHTGSRRKGALINAGGRLINWLFGNMDDGHTKNGRAFQEYRFESEKYD